MKKNKKNSNWGNVILLSTLFCSLILISSCADNPSEFTLGEEFIESQTSIALIDTFSVNVSTVILDTINGNGTGSALVGTFSDEYIGKVTSNSYMQFGIPDNFSSMLSDEVYDSISLIIRYNDYSYGDTTQMQHIAVHQLTENIKYEDEVNYTISSQTELGYLENSIGSIDYFPTPSNADDTLYIKLDDKLGLDLFNKIQDQSETLYTSGNFLNYFYGLVLKADETKEGAIISFQAHENAISMVVHTTREDISTEHYTYEFGIYNYEKQFNNINFDLSTTSLNKLLEQKNELNSNESAGMAFLQGGIGLALKVSFPSLSEVMLLDRGTIMEASLTLSILDNSFEYDLLPTSLVAYTTNRLNKATGFLYNNLGGTVYSTLSVDELYGEESTYEFDVTKYLTDEVSDSYVDPEQGVLISLPSGSQESTFTQVIIDAEHKNSNLKIYYVTY